MRVYISGEIECLELQEKIERFAIEFGLKLIFEESGPSKINIERIKHAIEFEAGFSFEEYTTPCRNQNKYFARMIFVHFCREFDYRSSRELMNLLNRDNTTINRYINGFETEFKLNREFRELVNRVESLIIHNID